MRVDIYRKRRNIGIPTRRKLAEIKFFKNRVVITARYGKINLLNSVDIRIHHYLKSPLFLEITKNAPGPKIFRSVKTSCCGA